MKRHEFDPLSFVFGLLFLAVGLPLMFSESGLAAFEGRWVFPAFLIIAGAIVLANARKRERDREAAEQSGPAQDEVDNFIY